MDNYVPFDLKKSQNSIMVDVKSVMSDLGPLLLKTKMEQQQVLEESAANGGASTPQGALQDVLSCLKISVRRLAVTIKISRKKLQAMVDGHMDIPPETVQAIWDGIEKLQPGALGRLEKLAGI